MPKQQCSGSRWRTLHAGRQAQALLGGPFRLQSPGGRVQSSTPALGSAQASGKHQDLLSVSIRPFLQLSSSAFCAQGGANRTAFMTYRQALQH